MSSSKQKLLNKMSNKDFEKFWSEYKGTFPGYARGAAIESICKEVALAAWIKAQDKKMQND